MWDYGFMASCFAILVIFLVYYLVNKRIPIRLNRTFIELLVLETLFIPLEMLVTFLNDRYATVPPFILNVLNMTLITAYLLRILLFYRFTVNYLRIKPGDSVAKTLISLSVFSISVMTVMINPIGHPIFSIDGTGYHTGPLYYIMIRFCFIFYVVLSMVLLFVNLKRSDRRKFLGAMAYNIALLSGEVYTLFVDRSGLMNIFCLIAIIMIYLTFQNPDFYMSDRGPVFNLRALDALLDETVNKKDYLIMGVTLQNYNYERGVYGGERMDEALVGISRFFAKKFPRQMVFYLRNGSYVILGGELTSWGRLYEEVTSRFAEPWLAGGSGIYLNVSFVRLDSTMKMNSADEIIDHLMIELEKADDGVKPNTVLTLDAASVEAIRRQSEVKHYLDTALARGKVEVFLQPLVDAKTGQLAGAEALARLRDNAGNIIMPDEFIGIAEKDGTIDLLGEQIFDRVCAYLKDPRLENVGMSWINVNLSPVQCMKRDLSKKLIAAVSRNEFDISRIRLEITEQTVGEYSAMHEQIEALKNHGFSLILDDYGSGYSNLARLKRYPFVNIKLDMEVVWSYFRDRDDILPNLVQTFKRMNYGVTAEGVETEEMARVLTEMGCDYLQGFYFSPPLSFERFLEKYRT